MSLSLDYIISLTPVERRRLVRGALTEKFGPAAKGTTTLMRAWGPDSLTSSVFYLLIHNPAGFFSAHTQENIRQKVFNKLWPEYAEIQVSKTSKPQIKISRIKEPEDKNSFGHILWRILGGPDIISAQARADLGISSVGLSQYLHRGNVPTSRFIEERGWRDIFAQKYPLTWAENKQAFDTKIENRPSSKNVFKRIKRSRGDGDFDSLQSTTPHDIDRWRTDVSNFITSFCIAKGDNPEDLEPDITSILLRKHWRAVIGLDAMPTTPLPNSVFVEAINTVAKLYSLKPQTPGIDQSPASQHDWQAFRLLARAPL